MKKIVFGCVLVMLTYITSTDLSAQAFAKENFVANAGIGVGGGSYYGAGTSSIGFSFSLEKGFMETGDFGIIGIGGNIGHRVNTFAGIDRKAILIGPRGTYHFSVIPVEALDVYAAVQTDIVFLSSEGFENRTDVDISFIAAARYYFSNNFGAFAEVGINGYSALTGGISYKF